MYSAIDSFIDRKIVVLKDTDTALKAARAMCDNQVGCVIVYNEDSELCGILTDRDITCNLISEELDSYIALKKIMETDIVTLPESGSILEAIQLMKDFGIRRIPITSVTKKHQKKCVGIVTLDDLIAGQFINSLDLSDIVKSQIRRRKVFEYTAHNRHSTATQTYNRFIAKFSDAFELDKKITVDIVMYLLGAIVQRLHYTGGTHFISQLPKHIQEPLFDLPAGPNRSISDETIIQGLKLRTNKSMEGCLTITHTFWSTLHSIIGEGETTHIIHQLPNELRELFSPMQSIMNNLNINNKNTPPPPPMEKL